MADVTFVLHGTTEVSHQEFQAQKDIAKLLIDMFPPYGADGVRIAVILYGRNAVIWYFLSSYRTYPTKTAIKDAINSLPQNSESGANVREVFRLLKDRLYSTDYDVYGPRPTSPRIVFWMVGHNRTSSAISTEAASARESNITVIPIPFAPYVSVVVPRQLPWNSNYNTHGTGIQALADNARNIFSQMGTVNQGRFFKALCML